MGLRGNTDKLHFTFIGAKGYRVEIIFNSEKESSGTVRKQNDCNCSEELVWGKEISNSPIFSGTNSFQNGADSDNPRYYFLVAFEQIDLTFKQLSIEGVSFESMGYKIPSSLAYADKHIYR